MRQISKRRMGSTVVIVRKKEDLLVDHVDNMSNAILSLMEKYQTIRLERESRRKM